MKRPLDTTDIQQALQQAYQTSLDITDGAPDPRLIGVDPDRFGMTVVLTDGTTVEIGDTDVKAPLGDIARLPILLTLMQQLDEPSEAAEREGAGCGCSHDDGNHPHIAVNAHGVRAISAVEPNGDSDGKWEIIMDGIVTTMGSAPTLDDQLYKRMTKTNIDTNAEDVLADARFYLYDNAAASINLYTRLMAMEATATQLAVYGATIAAGGHNPVTKSVAFDSALSTPIVEAMALQSPLPAQSSFSGMIVGIVPRRLAIAVYSPRVDRAGLSVRGAAALTRFLTALRLNHPEL